MRRALALCICILCTLALSLTAQASGVPRSVVDAKHGVVKIYSYSGENYISGTGFVLDNSESGCIIATNHHVVEGGDEFHMYFDGQGPFVLELVAVSPERDLSIVRTTVKVRGVVPLKLETGKIQSGDAVFVLGYPAAADAFAGEGIALTLEEMTLTNGIISAIQSTNVIGNQAKKVKLIQTNADINQGNSGGPMLNSHGRVVGVNTVKMVYEGVSGINGSVHVSELKAFLDIKSIPYNKTTINYTLVAICAGAFLVLVVVVLTVQLIRLTKRLKNPIVPPEPVQATQYVETAEQLTFEQAIHAQPIAQVEQPPAPAPKQRRRGVWLAAAVTMAVVVLLGTVTVATVVRTVQRNEQLAELEQSMYLQDYERVVLLVSNEPWLESHIEPEVIPYCEAMLLVQQAEIEKAAEEFEKLGSYADSEEQLGRAEKYLFAKRAGVLNSYQTFVELGNYADSAQMVLQKQEELYNHAIKSFDDGDYKQAELCFAALPIDYAEDIDYRLQTSMIVQDMRLAYNTSDTQKEIPLAMGLANVADQMGWSSLSDYIMQNNLHAFLHGTWSDSSGFNYFEYDYINYLYDCSFYRGNGSASFYPYERDHEQLRGVFLFEYKDANRIAIHYMNQVYNMQRYLQ